jgi:hypothetical protein
MKKIWIWLLLSFSFLATASAQKKVVLEQVSYATPINYLNDKTAQHNLAVHLNTLLEKYYHAQLSDTGFLPVVPANGKPERSKTYDEADTGTWHMEIMIQELVPSMYYMTLGIPVTSPEDSAQRARIKTIFKFYVSIVNNRNEPVAGRAIDVLVFHNKTVSMGPQSQVLFVLPSTFLEVARRAMSELMDPLNNKEQIGLAVPPVVVADNFFMPRLTGKQRYYVTEKKGIYTFSYDTIQMLRKSEPVYHQLQLKGRNAIQYPEEIMQVIRKAPNRAASDFLFLQQEWRDVIGDKNYLVKLFVQVNPEEKYLSAGDALTGFLPGNIQLLISDKDTLARFSISKFVPDAARLVYFNRVYNGIDSVTLQMIGNQNLSHPQPYPYVAEGMLSGIPFTVKCSGPLSMMKEFYLDGKLVCIAQGRLSPEIFVVFDASLSPEMLIQLFAIGFNGFFQ